ncbi:unnamed protein product, partial [Iphiclides podalirius]
MRARQWRHRCDQFPNVAPRESLRNGFAESNFERRGPLRNRRRGGVPRRGPNPLDFRVVRIEAGIAIAPQISVSRAGTVSRPPLVALRIDVT